MNQLLQKHGCSNVFVIPEGLKELMSDISREVLREQPTKIYEFIANYLSCLLITREHGILSIRLLDDLCDCRPTVSEHLIQIGLEDAYARDMSEIIKQEIESSEVQGLGKAKLREAEIIKKILDEQSMTSLDESHISKVCQVIRHAYRNYWYKKNLLQKSINVDPQESWEIAAQRTLEIYMKTQPSPHDLSIAAEKIQAAYKGYYVRKNLLHHLVPKIKEKMGSKPGPEMAMAGPPIDVAGSREMLLGNPINIEVKEVDTQAMDSENNIFFGFETEEKTSNGGLKRPSKSIPSRLSQQQDRRHSGKNSHVPVKESDSEKLANYRELSKMISFSQSSPLVFEEFEDIDGPAPESSEDHSKAVHAFIQSFDSKEDQEFSLDLD